MRLRRRNLRKGLVVVGCGVGVPWWPAWGLGLLGLSLGSALHVWTKGVLEQNQRVVTAGPYRWTRNPFYLANLLIDLGLCLVIGRLSVAVVYLALWAWSYRETIAREEAHLRGLFGDELDRYRARVPRLLPMRRPLPREEACGGFSWANPNLSRGREYARILGLWLAAAAIAAAILVRREGLGLLSLEHRGELGLILLLGAGWILKLALAQTFRHPESSLLPRGLSPRGRVAVAIGALAPLLWAIGSERGGIEMGTALGLALGLGLALVLALAWGFVGSLARDASPQAGKRSCIGSSPPFVVAGVSIVVLLAVGALWNQLWLAIPPALWLMLATLDELGRLRLERIGQTKQATWPYLSRIGAMAAAAALLLMGLLSFEWR